MLPAQHGRPEKMLASGHDSQYVAPLTTNAIIPSTIIVRMSTIVTLSHWPKLGRFSTLYALAGFSHEFLPFVRVGPADGCCLRDRKPMVALWLGRLG